MNVKETIIELCDIPGPAGFEEKVAARAKALLEEYMDEVWTDVLGNVIGVRKCGKKNAVKLLFDAHIDEIGLIVTGIEEGFLRFERLGGLDARVIPATGVELMTEPPIFGVISVLPPHILKKEDTDKNFKTEDLFIDVGMKKDDAKRLISQGTPGVIVSSIKSIGDDLICGKAIDDRAGFVAILRALELLKDTKLEVDLYVMASTQEEVGVRGATTGAYSVAPDYCVVVDVGHAKTPDSKAFEANTKLGDGVTIERGPNMTPSITEKMVSIAQTNDIPYQINVTPGGSSGTNARAIQISAQGVATGVLELPLKYMHCANEMASLADVESTAKLLSETAKAMKGDGV